MNGIGRMRKSNVLSAKYQIVTPLITLSVTRWSLCFAVCCRGFATIWFHFLVFFVTSSFLCSYIMRMYVLSINIAKLNVIFLFMQAFASWLLSQQYFLFVERYLKKCIYICTISLTMLLKEKRFRSVYDWAVSAFLEAI